MRYRATVGDRTFGLEISGNPGQLRVSLDGVPEAIDLHCADGRRLYSLLLDGRSYEVLVECRRDGYLVDVEGQTFTVSLQDERQARTSSATAGLRHPEGELQICAPMPGLVSLVNVGPGDPVKRGRALVVLEAMKMENDLSSPRDGVVKEVRARPGQKVDKGDVLVVVH